MKTISRTLIITLILTICVNGLFAGGPDYWKGKGRIALSSDGNMHDNDDWAATAASLMILAKAKLQDSVVLYTYSDHVWGSEDNDRAQMKISAVDGGTKFGFTKTNFMEAVADPEAAYNAMRDAINASTAESPLFIIAAGPMQVVGEAMNRANSQALQHVTLISHSTWNDNHSDRPQLNSSKTDYEASHSGWTWAELENKFGSSVNFNHIPDQNEYTSYDVGFASTQVTPDKWAPWYWMRDHADARVKWVWDRGKNALKRPDFSDAGMAFYLTTGFRAPGPQDLEAYIAEDFDADVIIEIPDVGDGEPLDSIVYGENYIVFEADATVSPLGGWVLKTPESADYVAGNTDVTPIGDDYLEFLGSSGTSPLTYTFICPKTGDYQLTMRLLQHRKTGEAGDQCNDVFIKMDGDFTSACKYSTDQLKTKYKYFGHGAKGWGVGYKVEPSHGNYDWAVYHFTKGEKYTLTMWGRSERTAIDYILLFEKSIDMHINYNDDLASFNDPKYRPDAESVPLDTAKVKVDGLTLVDSVIQLKLGQPAVLQAAVSPANAYNQDLIWEAGDNSIAFSSENIVRALAPGTTFITVKSSERPDLSKKIKIEVFREGQAMTRLDRSGMKAIYADSWNTHTPEKTLPPEYVLDGDPTTKWHTAWKPSPDPMPHEIHIDFGKEISMDQVDYLPRDNGPNGIIKDYEVYVSNDKDNWGNAVKTGTFSWGDSPTPEQQMEMRFITFDTTVKGRYLRLLALSEINGLQLTSAAELYFCVKGENTGLDEAVAGFSMYPNPASNILTINMQQSCHLSMMSLSGKTIKKQNLLSGINHLDISNMTGGIYICSFNMNNRVYTQKLIIE